MNNTTPSATPIPGNPRSGVIFESGLTDGYAYTRVMYDADRHTVSILCSTTLTSHLDASHLGDTILSWAKLCHECRAGLWNDMRLGPVGHRLADQYANHLLKVSA